MIPDAWSPALRTGFISACIQQTGLESFCQSFSCAWNTTIGKVIFAYAGFANGLATRASMSQADRVDAVEASVRDI